MFDQVAVSEAGCVFIVPPYVSASPACTVTAITMGKVSRHRSAGGRGGLGLRVLFVVAAVVFAGFVVLPRGSVAADQVSFAAAQGQLGSPATVITDPTATDGQAVRFNAPIPDSAGFVHPGILVDPSQISYVQDEIAAGASPWTPALAAVNPFYTKLSYAAGPYATVDCSATSKSCTNVVQDAIAAYTFALLYSYSTAPDRAKYADAAIAIMNAWSATLTKANGNQARLDLAWSAEVFPRAAEILRYTFASGPGDQVLNVAAFTNMLNNVYVPTLIAGDPQSNGNWELSMADGLINIGVFTDNRSVFNSGVAMWRARVPAYIYLSTDNNANGQPIAPPGGNYSNPAALTCFWLGLGTNKTTCTVPAGFTYHDGMTQETCRDMSHPMEGLGAMVNAAETARLQGVDLYGEQKQRITDAYEYAAAYDSQYLTTHVWPASPCGGQPGSHSGQGGDGTGGSSYMYGWEIAYNEYANRLGVSMPNTQAMIARFRPSGGVNATDWETLANVGASASGGCPAPDIRSGIDTMTVTVPADGTYQLWSRVNPQDSSDTSYALQVDGGCPINIGGASMPAGQWTWANYENGDPNSSVSVPLTAGTHTLELIGVSSGLAVDSVMFVADPTCVPVDFGDNCAPSGLGSPDQTAPTTAMTAPNDGDTVSGTVPLTATAADDTAIARVSFLVDGSVVGFTTSDPYIFSWNSTTVPDGPHTVQSRAYDTSGNSTDSAPVTITTMNADVTPPSAPSDVTATATSATSVGLTWTAATDDTGVTSYLVYRDGTQVGTSASTTYSDSGLTQLTDYTYTVYATDGAGNVGPASDPSTATTPDGTPPTAPGSFAATVALNQVTLTWTPATDNVGVTSYVLSRNGVQINQPTGLTFVDSAPSAGASYTYALTATDAAGNLGPAAIVTITTPDVTPPSAPATFTAVATSSSQVNLTWTAATDDVGVTAYVLTRGGVRINKLAALTFADSGLAPSTSYTYAITAVDAAGNVSPAKTVTVTTLAAAAPPGSGWAGAYFANTTLSGAAITRADPTVNFSWGTGAPISGIGADNFSARWTGQLTPPKSGTYTFYTQADGGVRLYINDNLVINHWTAGANSKTTTYGLTAGKAINVRLEYFDTTGAATAQLLWSGPSLTKAVVPATVMNPASAGLTATYFSGTGLTTAAVVRLDDTLNFSWGTGSPDSRVPVDNFSARWTGKIKPTTSATYTFYTDAAGGMRLWVNGVELVNNWMLHNLATNSGKIALTAGTSYDIKVEYQVGTQSAVAKLSWSTSSAAKAIVPQSVLRDR